MFKIKNIKRKQNILNNLKIIISILCLSILSTILTEENFLNVVRAEYEGEVGTVNQSGNDNDWVTENFDDIQIFSDVYEDENVTNNFFKYIKDVKQQGMKTYWYLDSNWYEEEKSFDDVVSQSDKELLSTYEEEYMGYADTVEHFTPHWAGYSDFNVYGVTMK